MSYQEDTVLLVQLRAGQVSPPIRQLTWFLVQEIQHCTQVKSFCRRTKALNNSLPQQYLLDKKGDPLAFSPALTGFRTGGIHPNAPPTFLSYACIRTSRYIAQTILDACSSPFCQGCLASFGHPVFSPAKQKKKCKRLLASSHGGETNPFPEPHVISLAIVRFVVQPIARLRLSKLG